MRVALALHFARRSTPFGVTAIINHNNSEKDVLEKRL